MCQKCAFVYTGCISIQRLSDSASRDLALILWLNAWFSICRWALNSILLPGSHLETFHELAQRTGIQDSCYSCVIISEMLPSREMSLRVGTWQESEWRRSLGSGLNGHYVRRRLEGLGKLLGSGSGQGPRLYLRFSAWLALRMNSSSYWLPSVSSDSALLCVNPTELWSPWMRLVCPGEGRFLKAEKHGPLPLYCYWSTLDWFLRFEYSHIPAQFIHSFIH